MTQSRRWLWWGPAAPRLTAASLPAGWGIRLPNAAAWWCLVWREVWTPLAMKGALLAEQPVVGVLGNGLDVVYPRSNRDLYRDVAWRGVSAVGIPPGTPPIGRNFPRRNRIISGLTCGVVVVEAPARSGALITAQLALDQGRMCLPFGQCGCGVQRRQQRSAAGRRHCGPARLGRDGGIPGPVSGQSTSLDRPNGPFLLPQGVGGTAGAALAL